jgi:glucose-6-phosphate isomerase
MANFSKKSGAEVSVPPQTMELLESMKHGLRASLECFLQSMDDKVVKRLEIEELEKELDDEFADLLKECSKTCLTSNNNCVVVNFGGKCVTLDRNILCNPTV